MKKKARSKYQSKSLNADNVNAQNSALSKMHPDRRANGMGKVSTAKSNKQKPC
jgi:hypothetical protein